MKTTANPAPNRDQAAAEDAGRRITAWESETAALIETDKLTPELSAQLRAKYFPEPLPASSPFPEATLNTRQRIVLLCGAIAVAVILATAAFSRPGGPRLRLIGDPWVLYGRDYSGTWRATGIVAAATLIGVLAVRRRSQP